MKLLPFKGCMPTVQCAKLKLEKFETDVWNESVLNIWAFFNWHPKNGHKMAMSRSHLAHASKRAIVVRKRCSNSIPTRENEEIELSL